MDAELKQYLDEMKGQLKAHIDQTAGETKSVLKVYVDQSAGETKSVLKAYIDQSAGETKSVLKAYVDQSAGETKSVLKAYIDQTAEDLRTHTSQECEKVETKLLSEFFKWGRTSDMRTRQALENVTAFNERLMAIEDRVTSLERKPAA